MAISNSPFDRLPKRQRRRSSAAFIAGTLTLVVLVVLVIMFRQQAAGAFWYVAEPVMRVRESLGASQATQLRAELALKEAALVDRDALYKENVDLKERLGRQVAYPRVLAGILQRPPWVPYDTLMIDAGAAQGLVVGDYVAAAGTALIGRVREVYDSSARVELFSSPEQSYQGLLNGAPVAVEGQGGGSLRAELPAGSTAKVGDTVSLPGVLGGVLAQVVAVDQHDGESFIVIYMRLPANPQELRYVEVWKL